MMSFFARFAFTGPCIWKLQLITSLLMAGYLVVIVCYLMTNPALTYDQWSELNSLLPMRVFTLLVVAAVAFHAWIGMRCVFTDYITVRLIGPKANGLRNTLQLGLAFMLLFYLLWTIKILWGL